MDYNYVDRKVKESGKKLPLTAQNEHNENVVISGGESMYHVMTFQRNGWCRENEYYPDGLVTETFSR